MYDTFSFDLTVLPGGLICRSKSMANILGPFEENNGCHLIGENGSVVSGDDLSGNSIVSDDTSFIRNEIKVLVVASPWSRATDHHRPETKI